MKKCVLFVCICLVACAKEKVGVPASPFVGNLEMSPEGVARMLSRLPIGEEQLREVFDAVNSSSSDGYDEEYMMRDLLDCPGSGVGDKTKASAAVSSYSRPLRTLISDYLSATMTTKSGASDVERYLSELGDSGMQIYWPYSEDWDGEAFPIITFDPGYGAESNYGYRIARDGAGFRVVDSVFVDENVAKTAPVWVINRNDDSAFTPMEMVLRNRPTVNAGSEVKKGKKLLLKDFKMLRNYDSWFAGASEFFIKCGSVDGFKASTESELKNYYPSVTDMMVVIKRKYKGMAYPLNALLISDFTEQMQNIAFLVTEDDGGTVNNWKCSALVKINSKSYGFEMEIPYHEKDDIVWRGQLSSEFLNSSDASQARFGDTVISFELQ